MKIVRVWLALLAGAPLSAQPADLRFASSTSNVQLAATLQRVSTGRTRAAAVLVSVAGPDDRDMTVGPHRLFGELADSLSRHGIASLRFDDRGVGGSKGAWQETTFADRAADVCAAVAELRKQLPQIPVGVIGMSEGGGLALWAHNHCSGISFVVLLSTPLRSGRTEIGAQISRAAAAAPVPDSTRQSFVAAATGLISLLSEADVNAHRDSIRAILTGPFGRSILPPFRFVPRDPEGQLGFLLSPWYRSQVQYDVLSDLSKASSIPILGIYGTKDTNIDAIASSELLRLTRPEATIFVMPLLNHVLQLAQSGSPAEYARLPAGIDASIARHIAEWISKVVAAEPRRRQ